MGRDPFDLLRLLRKQWDREEVLAREVSRCREAEGVPLPQDWHWVCNDCDASVPVDPANGTEEIFCTACKHESMVSLRSIQEFPWSHLDGMGPDIRLTPEDDVSHLLADHLATYDPARVMTEIKAKREMVSVILEAAAVIDGEWGCGHTAQELDESCTDDATMDFLRKMLIPMVRVYRGIPEFYLDWAGDSA